MKYWISIFAEVEGEAPWATSTSHLHAVLRELVRDQVQLFAGCNKVISVGTSDTLKPVFTLAPVGPGPGAGWGGAASIKAPLPDEGQRRKRKRDSDAESVAAAVKGGKP